MEEKGVLKIVYPNRSVEIHKQPVTAAQILKKHPRHSVTRPDVFEYPWIVVNPESVLTLGKVFFVVPNLTIYNLLKQHRERHEQPPHHCQSPMINNVQKQVQNQNSGGKTIRQQLINRQRLKLLPALPMGSCIWMGSEDREESYRKVKNPSRVESWPRLMKFRETNSETKDKLLEDLSRSCRKKGKKDGDLKSCLKKPDSVRKLLGLKVSFAKTKEDEEQQIGVCV